MTKETYLQLQERFIEAYAALPRDPSRLLEFEKFESGPPRASTGIKWLIFDHTLRDHVISLVNASNQFYLNTLHLTAWKIVLDESDEQTRLDLLWNVVDNLATGLLSTPYMLQSRCVYCAIMLLHEAAQIRGGVIRNYIDERAIKRKWLHEGQYRDFAEALDIDIGSLVTQIEALNEESLRDQRNRFHHRIPRNVEFGWSPTITRAQRGGKVAYGLSGTQPFSISDVLLLLDNEHRKGVGVFYQYWKLAEGLVSRIDETGGQASDADKIVTEVMYTCPYKTPVNSSTCSRCHEFHRNQRFNLNRSSCITLMYASDGFSHPNRRKISFM